MSKKGVCRRRRIVYGVVTVSSKGQISIPADLRHDLGIKEGDQLLVLRRKDDAGLVLVKIEYMDELMSMLRDDEEFFRRIRGGGR
ncbi:MAG TPA: AbrB/MazE/SpoVT family DNA-binding domain-containing protein [Candidatus Korarchaeota archaeon]|nr:AbrB/MazE/SpoVT family DNA-binding domain-containing protein [Candidatus Korarchaeota archaeon]